MPQSAIQTTTFEWLRGYIALSRSGHVTEAIRTCEEAWGEMFDGDPAAVEAVRQLPEYPQYVQALRRVLSFPLTLYRVTTAEAYETWRCGRLMRPVATSLSVDFARVLREIHPERHAPLVLITGALLDPEAVIMRGRIEGYELVVDSAHVSPVDVAVLE